MSYVLRIATERTKFIMPTAWRLIAAALLVFSTGVPTARTQAPAKPPARVVSIIPAVTEMLFAIGAGPQVVAVGSFDRYPPAVEKLPRVGALLDPDLERILALRPDLVVVYATQTELRQQLDRAGISQFVYQHARLNDVMATLRQVSTRVGRASEGEALAATIERSLDGIRKRVAGRARPRTLIVIARESGALRGIFASGGIGFLHDMVDIAGGDNVFAEVSRQSVQATSELVLAKRPDVILELRGTPLSRAEVAAERRAWNSLPSLPAVRADRIYMIADERTVVPGPRVAEGTELLARALHPEAFK